jgi:hypothetical protein
MLHLGVRVTLLIGNHNALYFEVGAIAFVETELAILGTERL